MIKENNVYIYWIYEILYLKKILIVMIIMNNLDKCIY